MSRFLFIDALRGLAILFMVVFHFCFDLAYFGLTGWDFYNDPFWLHARTLILGTFLLLVGVSLVLAHYPQRRTGQFLHRLARIAIAAALVSLVTWLVFGPRWVYFGVLHFIVVASVLGLVLVSYPRASLVLAVGILLLGNFYHSAWFDQWHWRWVGLMTHRPATEDYVPLLPWFGVVLCGIVLGHAWHRLPATSIVKSLRGGPALHALAGAGRHSLVIYLLHQPILMALLWLVVRINRV